MYVDHHVHEGQESRRLKITPGRSKYIFIYPFEKTREWYLLTKAARQGMMDEHIEIGHKYPSVKLNTTYSFGLDDQDSWWRLKPTSLKIFLILSCTFARRKGVDTRSGTSPSLPVS